MADYKAAGSASQSSRIKTKVSGEAGRNAANAVGTAGQTVKPIKRMSVIDSVRKAMGSGDGSPGVGQPGKVNQPTVKRNSALKVGSFDGIEQNRQRNGKTSPYGGLPTNKKGGNPKGVD